ncbi:MAG: glycosyltransferase [Pseudomonadota bacterium]
MERAAQAVVENVPSPAGAFGPAGVFMLSFDCEGKWGLVDCLTPRHAQLFTTQNLEDAYRRITSLLHEYGIEATFAFTAAFTLTKDRFDRLRPALRHPDRRATPWIERAVAAIDEDDGRGWFAPACFDMVREPGVHEIASHGFSHLPWRAPYATRADLDTELAMCRGVPAFSDPSVRTFVFPRNQVAHQELLPARGFLAYREAPPARSRAANFAGEFNLLSASERFNVRGGANVTALPAGHFLNWRHGLRRCVPVPVTVHRWKNMLRDAAAGGGLVHAWTHPENFVDGHDMFRMLEEILRFVADEREAGRLRILTNTQFVARTEERSPLAPPSARASSFVRAPDATSHRPRRDTPLVSVGMAVLNGGDQLQMAVQSVLAQTMEDWEMLLIDDGSTDGAADAIAAIGDPRIHVVQDGRNKGLAVRLNETIAMARGRYFARMDHDDLSHPERFRRQVAAMQDDAGLDLLACRCIKINDDDEFTGYMPFAADHAQICKRAWLRFPMTHPSWLGRIEWFRQHRYPVPAPFYAEDFELLLRTCDNSKYAALPDVLLAYRVRSGIELKKTLRARRAQLALQRRHFVQKRQIGGALMATGAFLLRLGADGCRAGAQAAGMPIDPHRAVDPADAAEWRKVIEGYHLCAEWNTSAVAGIA